MRQLSMLLTFLLFTGTLALNAQNSAQSKGNKGKSKDKAMDAMDGSSMALPYTARYSSKFEMGNPKYSAIVLNAWKAYDDNKLDSANDFISDTLSATLADGTALKGKDNFINAIKSFRSGFTSAKSEVVVYMAVKSIDKGDDIVFIWGTETDVKNDGTTQKMDLHEVWAFNKDGKVDFFKQFMAQSPKENKQ